MTHNNIIPRKFYGIKIKLLIDTSDGKIGDIIHITKNDFGYLGYNSRTNKHYYYFLSMLRNKNCCEIIEVIK